MNTKKQPPKPRTSTNKKAGEGCPGATCSPIPEVSDADIAFPCRWHELLPKREEITDQEWQGRTLYCEAAAKLFYGGGKLEDYGVQVREGVDSGKVYRYMKATLGDWGPKHEHKMGGVGHMLAKWCEPIPENV